jgi:dienelactone hydrolase
MKPWMVFLLALVLRLPLAGPAFALEPTSLTADVDGTNIKIYLYRPKGAGPFPLLVLSHGSARSPADRADFGVDTLRRQAQAYVDSGVAVAVPIRRGYGEQSQGTGGEGGCASANYYDAGLAGARDIAAAIAVVSKLPGIDGSRVVLMGESEGGWASLAAATRGGVLGVVNFAGQPGSRGPDDICRQAELVRAAGLFGGAKRVPELWIYSRNDRLLSLTGAYAMRDAFVAAGGTVIFRASPSVPTDERTYIDAVPRWKPAVDTFLVIVGFLR